MLDATTERTRLHVAMHQAADHIERYPEEFNFYETSTPRAPHCGSPGCAIGWVAAFYGPPAHADIEVFAAAHLGGDDGFYRALHDTNVGDWYHNPTLCAAALRRVADERVLVDVETVEP